MWWVGWICEIGVKSPFEFRENGRVKVDYFFIYLVYLLPCGYFGFITGYLIHLCCLRVRVYSGGVRGMWAMEI